MGKNKRFIKKQSVLSELKEKYTDNQGRSQMIGIQPTILIFKLSTIRSWVKIYGTTNCAIFTCQLFFFLIFNRKVNVKSHVIDIANYSKLARCSATHIVINDWIKTFNIPGISYLCGLQHTLYTDSFEASYTI